MEAILFPGLGRPGKRSASIGGGNHIQLEIKPYFDLKKINFNTKIVLYISKRSSVEIRSNYLQSLYFTLQQLDCSLHQTTAPDLAFKQIRSLLKKKVEEGSRTFVFLNFQMLPAHATTFLFDVLTTSNAKIRESYFIFTLQVSLKDFLNYV